MARTFAKIIVCQKSVVSMVYEWTLTLAIPKEITNIYGHDPLCALFSPSHESYNSYDTKICGKAKRLVLLTRENAILVELTRYLSYYISILQWAGHELLPKCGNTFTKCELCKVPLA